MVIFCRHVCTLRKMQQHGAATQKGVLTGHSLESRQ